MPSLLEHIFGRIIVEGALTVRFSDGRTRTFSGRPGPTAALELRTREVERRLTVMPSLALGEGYMNGSAVPLDCTIYQLLDLLMLNAETSGGHPMFTAVRTARRVFRRVSQFNPAPRARRNVAHHYDLNGHLYSLFLDADRQYSCAYFPRGDETLDEAQSAKKHHIAAKLLLNRPDLEVLDIGSGWGGMALTLARDYGARVTGITLSTEQLAESRARAEQAGLADRVRFELMDYRAMDRRFDRIVSVGMFEHVGVNHYPAFFEAVSRCLKDDGVVLLHAIGRGDGPGFTDPWIAKYIFPGGYTPAISEVFVPLERSGLYATDVEILRLHYAQTLRHWRRRFAAGRDAIAALYDERFCRMFEFYLAGAELAFRRNHQMVFQIQMERHLGTVPLTRDYMVQAERAAPIRHAAE